MKKVLIVDDDKSFLQSLIDGFKAYEDKFVITTAEDGIQAVETLEKEDISLVLTDLKMPRMDGFELVAHLSSNYSEIPVIVMTAFGTPEMEKNLREIGTLQYIEKPIDFTILVDKILKGLAAEPSQGYITGVSLSSFLQLLEIDKKSCTLTINAESKKGVMYFRDGNLLDASHDKLQGSEAAYEIVSWNNVEISIDNKCSITDEKIKESLGFVLLEGSRRKDENDASSRPAESQDSTSLDSLNLKDLELKMQEKETDSSASLATGENPSAEQSDVVANNPVLAQFITMLSSFPEIESATVSSQNGAILHQTGEANENMATFITYVALTMKQIESAIGSSGSHHSIFNMNDNSKLIILCGQEIVVGLKVGDSASPASIADGLRPVLSRINLTS